MTDPGAFLQDVPVGMGGRRLSSRKIVILRYNRPPHPTLAVPDNELLKGLIRDLETGSDHDLDFVDETPPGLTVPNGWNREHISGPLGSVLAHAISTRDAAIGAGVDMRGQLLVGASMCGVIGFYAPRPSAGRGRLTILGHTVSDIHSLWLDSLQGDLAGHDFSANIYPTKPVMEISAIVPEVYLAKGRFWDWVHFDARTNYALAIRKFEQAGITVTPADDVVTKGCREAASLIIGEQQDIERQQRFEILRSQYSLPVQNSILLLPTAGLAAPRIADWPLLPGRYDPDPFETIMPAVLSDSLALTVPNGFSADGLPMGLTMIAPHQMADRLFALAEWFRIGSPWPTLAGAARQHAPA